MRVLVSEDERPLVGMGHGTHPARPPPPPAHVRVHVFLLHVFLLLVSTWSCA